MKHEPIDPASTVVYLPTDGNKMHLLWSQLTWHAATVADVLRVLGGRVLRTQEVQK